MLNNADDTITNPVESRLGAFWTWGLMAVALSLGVGIHQFTILNHDVNWFLIAAQRMLSGGSYLTDFYEVNAPAAIAAYIPPLGLSALGLDAKVAVIVYVLGLIGWSLFWSKAMLNMVFPSDRTFVGMILVAQLGILMLLPGYHFGQRDHLFVILIFPFAYLCAAALLGYRVGRSRIIWISAAAALGSFIKPHFIVLPIVLALHRTFVQRSIRALLAPEFLVFVVLGLGYAGAVLILFPDWFAVVRRASTFYMPYGTNVMGVFQTTLHYSAILLIMLALGRLSSRSADQWCLIQVLFWTVVGLLLAYVLQFKGFTYHTLAFQSVMAVMLAAICLEGWKSIRERAIGTGTGLSAAIGLMLLIAPIFKTAIISLQSGAREYEKQDLTVTVRSLAENRPIYILSATLTRSFPLVHYTNTIWASRFPSLWPLPELSRQLEHVDALDERQRWEALAAREEIIRMVVDDLEHNRPELILVDEARFKTHFAQREFDFLNFFNEDAKFRRIWSQYTRINRIGDMGVYQRRF